MKCTRRGGKAWGHVRRHFAVGQPPAKGGSIVTAGVLKTPYKGIVSLPAPSGLIGSLPYAKILFSEAFFSC